MKEWWCNEKLKISSSGYENLVALELEYTIRLSLSKFYLYLNQDKINFVKEITKLIELDNYDSTSYLELGLYYFKNSEFTKCKQNLIKALENGPPGIGLIYFYLGECRKKTGDIEKAVEYYWRCLLFVVKERS